MILDNKSYSKSKILSDKNFTLFFIIVFLLFIFFFTYRLNFIAIVIFSLLITILLLIYNFTPNKISYLKNKWLSLGFFLSKIIGTIIVGLIFICIICPTGIYYKFFKIKRNRISNFEIYNSKNDFRREY